MDRPPACKYAWSQDGKQEIYLEWPKLMLIYDATSNPIANKLILQCLQINPCKNHQKHRKEVPSYIESETLAGDYPRVTTAYALQRLHGWVHQYKNQTYTFSFYQN